MLFGRVKTNSESSAHSELDRYNLYKTAYTVFITIATKLLHFASTNKQVLQEISVQLIPTSFPTLVPFDQPGNTCHNLERKLNSVQLLERAQLRATKMIRNWSISAMRKG